MDEVITVSPHRLTELTELVRRHVAQATEQQNDLQPNLELELTALNSSIRGYSQSIANEHISPLVRQQIEADFAAALERKVELQSSLDEHRSRQNQACYVIDECEVLDRLRRLHEVLAADNATVANMELSLHIEKIETFEDGTVRMRTCKLGVCHEVVELLVTEPSTASVSNSSDSGETQRITQRRRGRRRVFDHERSGSAIRELADFAANPARFESLPDDCFWVDEFKTTEQLCWSEENADIVWEYWTSMRCSKAAVARHFGKSTPTIFKAIRFAEAKRSPAAVVVAETATS